MALLWSASTSSQKCSQLLQSQAVHVIVTAVVFAVLNFIHEPLVDSIGLAPITNLGGQLFDRSRPELTRDLFELGEQIGDLLRNLIVTGSEGCTDVSLCMSSPIVYSL